ncbi:DNA (cytosine-5-)methyltransferase [[Mycoplasma] cavipharyngis]|uniref:DNA cytosine methyltransferase n=1 Tax=[Mycoplasma] cavipharyngis TaxID=92757 RepID=UPI003704621C
MNDALKKSFKFVDLFAGIGGFHQALVKLGGKCVAACEIDQNAINVYQQNFTNTKILGNVNDLNVQNKIPKFDLLVAGFPCQPFSHCGKQLGFNDDRGKLYLSIIKILKKHPECDFVILENVKNLANKRKEWFKKIVQKLEQLGFEVNQEPLILSPHLLGIPQRRERVYILAQRNKNKNLKTKIIEINQEITKHKASLKTYFNPFELVNQKSVNLKIKKNKYLLSEEKTEILNIWENFINQLDWKIINPIWLHFMGLGIDNQKKFEQQYLNSEPEWKQKIILKNRKFYLTNKEFIDQWWEQNKSLLSKSLIYQKLEWNAGKEIKSFKNVIIQFRHSGIRTKKCDSFPTLTAITSIPIGFDHKIRKYRYLTVKEGAILQSFNSDFKFLENDLISFKQLGNAVNVKIIELLANKLIFN